MSSLTYKHHGKPGTLPQSYCGVWKTAFRKVLFLVILVFVSPSAVFAIDFPNPIDAPDFLTFVKSVAEAIRLVALPLAVLAIIVIGFRFVASAAGGNTKGVEEARKSLIWTLIGTAIIVGATVLAEAVINTIKHL